MFVSLLLEKTEQSDMVELLKDTLREQESMLEEQSEILNSKVEEIQGWETGKSSWPHFILSSKCNPARLNIFQTNLSNILKAEYILYLSNNMNYIVFVKTTVNTVNRFKFSHQLLGLTLRVNA